MIKAERNFEQQFEQVLDNQLYHYKFELPQKVM